MPCPEQLGSCSPVCYLGALCCVCGVLGHLAPVHRCARSVPCVACAVSWATWLLFTAVHAWCVVLRVSVLGRLAPAHRCARSVRPVVCAVSRATWPLFISVPARCVLLRVRCSGPLGSCSPVCSLRALCCVCGVLGYSAPVNRCARSVRCVVCAMSCSCGPCSPVCTHGVLCCVCGGLGHVAPVHRCASSVCSALCAVSWATWLLFTGVYAHCVVLRMRCPAALGFCSPLCPLGVLCCVRRVIGHLAPVHRCARSVCCAVCCVCGTLASWLLFTGVCAGCAVLRVRGIVQGRALVHPDGRVS